MPISLDGFAGYVRTRQSRTHKGVTELWIEPAPHTAAGGKVVLPKYDCVGVLYSVPQPTPTPEPDTISGEGFAGYLRRNPADGTLWVDSNLCLERRATTIAIVLPDDCLGVFYALKDKQLELLYPAPGEHKYEVRFPTVE